MLKCWLFFQQLLPHKSGISYGTFFILSGVLDVSHSVGINNFKSVLGGEELLYPVRYYSIACTTNEFPYCVFPLNTPGTPYFE